MNWADQRTRRAFEWAAEKLEIPLSDVVALVLQRVIGEKEVARRVNPGDTFPPDFNEQEIFVVVRIGILSQI